MTILMHNFGGTIKDFYGIFGTVKKGREILVRLKRRFAFTANAKRQAEIFVLPINGKICVLSGVIVEYPATSAGFPRHHSLKDESEYNDKVSKCKLKKYLFENKTTGSVTLVVIVP